MTFLQREADNADQRTSEGQNCNLEGPNDCSFQVTALGSLSSQANNSIGYYEIGIELRSPGLRF